MPRWIVVWTCAFATLMSAAHAQSGRWGSPDDPTVKEIRAKETMWANGNCRPEPALADVIADDFQGTATDGQRYRKATALETPNPPDRDCQFGAVRVQFFGDDLAVAYGNESSIRQVKNGKPARRCLAWTDTWLKRNGKWQIIAAQDNAVGCK